AVGPHFEGSERCFPGVEDLADTVQADQLKHRAHGLVDVTELQVASGRGDVLEAGQDGAAAPAIHKLDAVQIEDQLAALLQDWRHEVPKVLGIAGIELFGSNRHNGHVANL